MEPIARLAAYLQKYPEDIGQLVDVKTSDRLYHFDFTASNPELEAEIFTDTFRFSAWINEALEKHNCKYGIGGYMEHRTIYARSAHFNTDEEPRRLHLGVDIWAATGTLVYAPLAGIVHSFQDNDNFGDYGLTIILQHDLNGLTLYSLYGHLSRKSLKGISAGDFIEHGQQIAAFGAMHENGNWPPHLHFQLIFDLQGKAGDYPGVGKYSEKERWVRNIPDPQLILRFPKAVND